MRSDIGVIIGLDLGEKRIGVAFSNEERTIAIPLGVFTSLSEVAEKIVEKKANFLIVGWPLLLSGIPGTQCERVKSMLSRLLFLLPPIQYKFHDERFSSNFFGKIKDSDMHSATWILQSFLDSSSL